MFDGTRDETRLLRDVSVSIRKSGIVTENSLRVTGPEFIEGDGETSYSFTIHDRLKASTETYYFSVPLAYKSWLSHSLNPALPIATLRSMALRRPLVVEGPVDALLGSRMTLEWQRLHEANFPDLSRVPIYFDSFEESPRIGKRKHVLAFSAGVDSMYSWLQLANRASHSAEKITHLLYISHGHFSDMASIRVARVKELGLQMGVQVVPLATNIYDAFRGTSSGTRFLYTRLHEQLFLSSALAIGEEPTTFHFSSTYPIETTNRIDRNQSDNAVALLLWMGTTQKVSFQQEGSGATRLEKIEAIAGLNLAHRALDVCINSPDSGKINCSRCSKCLSTIVLLESTGALFRFDGVFNLQNWSKLRVRAQLGVLVTGTPMFAEIRNSIRAKRERKLDVFHIALLLRIDYLMAAPSWCLRQLKGYVLQRNRLWKLYSAVRRLWR